MKKQTHFWQAFIVFLAGSPFAVAEKSFNGPYMGIGAHYTYNRIKCGAKTYRAMSPSLNVFSGYGWTNGVLYYGFEGSAGYDRFSKRKNGARLTKEWSLGASFRIGRILREHFTSFLRLGMRYDQYAFKPRGTKKNYFGAEMMVIGLGVDAFAGQKWAIRSEITYAGGTGFHRNRIASCKKPLNLGLSMSVSYFL